MQENPSYTLQLNDIQYYFLGEVHFVSVFLWPDTFEVTKKPKWKQPSHDLQKIDVLWVLAESMAEYLIFEFYILEMNSSIKYPYLPQRRDFFLTPPHPSGNFN